MLTKNCNAIDFTHKQIFKTLTLDNLGSRWRGEALKWGVFICTLCTFLRPPLIWEHSVGFGQNWGKIWAKVIRFGQIW